MKNQEQWIVDDYDMAEFFDAAEKGVPSSNLERISRLNTQERAKFSGVKTFEEAIKLAREGWAKGAEEVAKGTAEISYIVGEKMLNPEPFYDVSGLWVDVPRALSGDPENMVGLEEPEKVGTGKVLRIIVSCGFSYGVPTESINNRGCAICSLIDALEKTGKSVDVTMVCPVEGWGKNKDNKNRFVTRIKAKRCGEFLDVDRMAFVLCHPAFPRRMIFSTEELAEESTRIACGFKQYDGYGCPCEYPHDDDEADIYIGSVGGGGGGQWSTREASIDWVIGQLKNFGVEMKLEAEK